MGEPDPFKTNGSEDQLIQAAFGEVFGGSDVAHDLEHLARPLPAQINQFQVLGLIASGGAARVYLARQESPPRILALKVLMGGVSRSALRRFEQEARLLARLNHPDIVSIYEVGSYESENGPLPFYTMEHVDGMPLVEYACQHNLNTRERLALIARICDATQHAHLKGIVHRDLKPTNVLVTADGQPKVLDFGVARVIDAQQQATSMHTQMGELLGTLAYMSPEQIEGHPDDVDTRCDVYALGVICFQLLVDQFPYDIVSKPRGEVMHTICNVPAERLGRINRTYRGDIETMLAKAMEKVPARRYGTPAEMAADIDRFLNHEPILARPVGLLGRSWRWAVRERKLAASLAAIVLLLTVLAVVLASFLSNSRRVAEERHHALYAAEMNLAMQAFDQNEFLTTLRLLDRQVPKEGQEDLRSFEWYYLWKRLHGELHTLSTRSRVYAVRFSPTGNLLASSGDDDVVLWNTNDWTRHAILTGQHGTINCVAFNPTGQLLATGGEDGMVCTWDTRTGEKRTSTRIDDHSIQSLEFSPDGESLAAAASDVTPMLAEARSIGRIVLWDIGTGEVKFRRQYTSAATRAMFSPDGKHLVIGLRRAADEVVDLSSNQIIRTLPSSHPNTLDLCFNNDGSELAISSWGDQVLICSLDQDEPISTLPASRIQAIDFSPGGSFVATASNTTPVVRIWNVKDAEEVDVLLGHLGEIRSLDFSPDGNYLATGSEDGTVKIWDWKQPHQPKVLTADLSEVGALSMSANGTRVAAGDRTSTACVWDVKTGELVFRDDSLADWIDGVALSPDGQLFVAGSKPDPLTDEHPQIKVWDLQNEIVHELSGVTREVSCLAYSADGKFVAAGLYGGPPPGLIPSKVIIYDTDTWEMLWSANAHQQDLWCLAFSPNSELVATGGSDGQIRIWDVQTGKLTRRIDHGQRVTSVAFSPDGLQIASGHWPDSPEIQPVSVNVWDVDTGELLRTLPGHSESVFGLAYSPDGRTLASGGANGIVKLWDTKDGNERATFRLSFHGWVFGVAFTPDGRVLACSNGSAADPGQVILYEAASPDEVRRYLIRHRK